ncbi:MAG TPA: bacteriohemerythrin [Alphaproteobacteria bacterium]|nr:bacteriohemerythrin [Alphaproteobacteria bacterium]
MALIEWKQEFSVGIDDVDHEHQEMVALINELYGELKAGQASKEKVSGFLGEIHAKIAAHFALEEHIMQQARYDRAAGHKADHDLLLDDIGDIMERFEADRYFKYEDVLSEHLRDWFTVHFRTHDSRLHKMVSA